VSTRGSSGLTVVHVVVTDVFAGVERYTCQVANELARRGHRVVTVGGDPERMRAELDSSVVSRPAGTVVTAARALVGERGADIVHVHMTAAEAAAWLARPVQRAPIVATRHFARDRGSSAPVRALAQLTSRVLACDIAISEFVAASVSGPSILIPNGVPDRPQAELESPVVVMLQRLNAEKAPAVGIRAWSASGLGARGWRLVIAGDGDLRPSLVDLVGELGVTESISFLGNVADTDRLLTESSVFLAPAPAEPFGLSVVEAMSHGLPVVAARGGGHRETVGDEGFLFEPGDAGAAAEAMVALSQDRDLCRRVGAALRRRQQGMYSLPHHVDRLETLYRQLVDGSVPTT
jgi:glycosyltransferase involved in cell wall biosynthesis